MIAYTLLMATIAMVNVGTVVPTAAQSVVQVVVNGQAVNFDQPPVERAGRVFVPLRGVFEMLGASVVYQNGQINATGHGRTISLQIGSTQALVNGQPQYMDVPPFVIGSRTLVPLRFIAQALGAAVEWNPNSSTVNITGGRPNYISPPNRPPMPPQNSSLYLLNKRPLDVVRNPQPMIHAEFSEPVNRRDLRIQVDDTDMTRAASISSIGFDLSPNFALGGGAHRVRVSGTTRNGIPFATGWTFTIANRY
jgi:hypothetical protein